MIASSSKSLFAFAVLVAPLGSLHAQEPTMRSAAVVDLSFDEADGAAEDRAKAGAAKDVAQPMNAPARVTSPFWNVRGGKAVRLDAAKTQFFQVADSPDLDHTAGTTLSFYYLNLHEPTDGVFHGIAAKRAAADPPRTNYGLNFQPASGRLQVYINDGSGYKVVGFPTAQAFGYRRLAHLTATFRPGDAPEPDADADPDDLEIRLFVNGKPLKPQDAIGGAVTDDAGWITDVNVQGLLSDAPLTIGASFPNGEPVSALVDEFLVFNRPLSVEEAAKLFAEVAGPDAERLAKLETEAAPSAVPAVTDVSPRGLQVGGTTRLVVTGRNLGPEPVLSLAGTPASVTVLPESNADRLVADVAVPAEVTPAVVPFAVKTAAGVSTPVPLSIDRLPQKTIAEAGDGPVALPAALTGTLNGADRPKVAFDGKAGDRFVAEVELKRLGGGSDPVLELKTDTGAPVEIAWGRSNRGGDARLTAKLPRDGRYVLELHDLAYQAPASPFRLLVGDLHLIDAVLPPAVEAGGTRQGVALGSGIEGSVELAAAAGAPLAEIKGEPALVAQNALPAVPVSEGREFTEADAAAQAVDVAGAGLAPTYVTGRLGEPGEVDRLALHVQPGQALEVRVDARAVGSAVEPVVTVFEQGKQVARQAAPPGKTSVSLNVTPQAADGRVEIAVGDRLRGAGPEQLYRLRVAPAGAPECRVTGLDPSVVLPKSGRGVMRLKVDRAGSAGAVTLIPDEASGVTVEPAVIPPGRPSEEVFVTVAAAAGHAVGEWLSMTAEVQTPAGPLRRAVRFSPGAAVERFAPNRPNFRAQIVTSAAAPSLELAQVPAAAFKGVTDAIGVKVAGEVPEGFMVRFTLVSDEDPRPNDPKNPAAGMKPLVRISEDAVVPAGTADAGLALLVPTDVAAGEVRGVVKAEVVPHPFSDRVAAVGYSAPVRLAVREPIASLEPVGAAVVKAGENRQVKVAVKRGEGFAQPVRVELRGLPAGYAAAAIDLPADQAEATFTVSVPAGTAAGAVPEAELAVVGRGGAVLRSVKPFAIEVKP